MTEERPQLQNSAKNPMAKERADRYAADDANCGSNREGKHESSLRLRGQSAPPRFNSKELNH
jgi:hypothetical protein